MESYRFLQEDCQNGPIFFLLDRIQLMDFLRRVPTNPSLANEC